MPPGGLRGAPKRRGANERRKEKREKKEIKGAQKRRGEKEKERERREGKEKETNAKEK